MIIRILILLLAGATAAQAQGGRRNVLKISPASALGHVSTFCERVIGPQTALVIGVGFGGETYRYENNSTPVPEPGRFRYGRLTLEARRYLGERARAPLGLFVGGYGRFARLWVRDYSFSKGQFVRDAAGDLVLLERQTFVTTLGGYVGYQTGLIRQRLTLEAFMGLQLQLPSTGRLSTQSLPEAMSSGGVAGRLGITVGYAF